MALSGHFGNYLFFGRKIILTIVKSETKNDLRCAVRFPLHLPVSMHEQGEDNHAETQDISAGGVLIHCGVDYPIGSTIQFSICMPAEKLGAENDVQVECVGRVVRCAPAGDRVAVGAIIDEYHITR
jgi:hypothetical protein